MPGEGEKTALEVRPRPRVVPRSDVLLKASRAERFFPCGPIGTQKYGSEKNAFGFEIYGG
jgi:hypothetical protein